MSDAAAKVADDEKATPEIDKLITDLPATSHLHALYADPRTRPAIIRKIKERLADKEAATPAAAVHQVDALPPAAQTIAVDDGKSRDHGVAVSQDKADGSVHVKETTTNTDKSEPGVVKTHDRSTAINASKDGVDVTHARSNTVAVGDASRTATNSVGAAVDGDGLTLKGGHDVDHGMGEDKKGQAVDGDFKIATDGKIEGQGTYKRTNENANGSTSNAVSAGYADKQATFAFKRTVGTNVPPKDKAATAAAPAKVPAPAKTPAPAKAVAPAKAAAPANVAKNAKADDAKHKVADPKLAANNAAEPEAEPEEKKQKTNALATKLRVGNGGAGADVGGTHTAANGTTASATVGGDFNREGASAHAGFSVANKSGSSVHASVNAGVKVTAEKPVEVDGHYEVAYVRTVTEGASGGANANHESSGASVGGSLSASKSQFESGIRVFKDKAEAEKFQDEAAEEVKANKVDPATPAGALQIPVGETRGAGTASHIGADGSISLEGASLGAGGSKDHSKEVDVKRVSEKAAAITLTTSDAKEMHLSVSGPGVGAEKAQSSSMAWTVTYIFDLTTPAGKAAFAKFGVDFLPPAAGTAEGPYVHQIKVNENKDANHILGLNQDFKQTVSEDHGFNPDGSTTAAFNGKNSDDVKAGWFSRTFTGDADSHESTEIDARQKDGKVDSYTATMKFSGDSADRNRKAMGNTFDDDHKGENDEMKASGEWVISTDIAKATIRNIEDSGKFKGAKTEDDRMRILANWVAEAGPQAVAGMRGASAKSLSWDVELKGNKNFPGRKGRETLDDQVKTYNAAMSSQPGMASTYLVGVNAIMAQLGERYANVTDTKQFTDLPSGLRQQQIDLINSYIASFRDIRARCMIAMIAGQPGAQTAAHGGDEEKESANPQMKAAAAVRAKIAKADASILASSATTKTASTAVQSGLKYLIANERLIAGPKSDAKDYLAAAYTLNDRQVQLDSAIENGRLTFVAHMDNITAGNTLLTVTESKANLLEAMVTQLTMAAEALKPVLSDVGASQHAAYWATVAGEVGSARKDDNS